ncbi:MAG TPA: PaaI family thioesterase [Terriglobales bacterium]|nr:PaaI family thioesterase [Terriglobales bacterium]
MSNVPATQVAPTPRFDATAPPAIAKLIGFQLTKFCGGEATVELNSGPQHYNPMGTVHGGVLCDIADAAMGMAFASTLDSDQSFTTLELKINFLRPVWESHLHAKARVTSRGKTVGLVECDVIDGDGRLMARASSTCLVLSGKMAEGR